MSHGQPVSLISIAMGTSTSSPHPRNWASSSGRGMVRSPQSLECPGLFSGKVLVGDLNADGFPDVISHGSVTVVHLNRGTGGAMRFIRGDINGDGRIDLADAVASLSGLFGGLSIPCLKAADANDDGRLDIGDAIWLLRYLFANGSAPPRGLASVIECAHDPARGLRPVLQLSEVLPAGGKPPFRARLEVLLHDGLAHRCGGGRQGHRSESRRAESVLRPSRRHDPPPILSPSAPSGLSRPHPVMTEGRRICPKSNGASTRPGPGSLPDCPPTVPPPWGVTQRWEPELARRTSQCCHRLKPALEPSQGEASLPPCR